MIGIIQRHVQQWFKPKFVVLSSMALYLLCNAYSDDRSLMAGIGFILVGFAVRIWAQGYAVEQERFITSGPYAHLRHPLYLGNVLLAVGFIIMLKTYVVGSLFAFVCLVMYAYTIHGEENLLIAKFHQRYLDYRTVVPAVFPRWNPYPEGEKWSFSFWRLLKSQEYKFFIWSVVAVIGFHLKDEFFIEHERLDGKILALIVSAVVLVSLDFVADRFMKNDIEMELDLSHLLTITRVHVLLLIGLSYLFFFAGNNIVGLTHPDEVFYSQTAKEMLHRNSWLVPYLFDGLNFEKPIFSYWLFMISFAVLGVSSFAARFFPAIFALIGVLGIYALGRLAFKDAQKAFCVAIVLMSSLLYVGLGRTVFTDMFFTVWIELALVAFYWGYTCENKRSLGLILFWACSGLAVLTKGILGVIIPLVVAVLFLLFRGDLAVIFCRSFVLGLVAFMLIVVPWYAFIIKNFGQVFIKEFIYNDHVRRLFQAEHKGNDRWFFYPLSIIGLMAPWCVFVVTGLGKLIKNFNNERKPIYTLVGTWLAVVFCIFQAAHSKLVSYIFPLFPAVALLTGEAVAEALNEQRKQWLFFVSSIGLPVAVIVACLIALVGLPKYAAYRALEWQALGIFALIVPIVVWLFFRQERSRLRMALIAVQIPLMLAVVFAHHDAYERYVSSQESCAYLMRNVTGTAPILCSKKFLRSTRYFTDKEVIMLNMNGEGEFFSPHPVEELRSKEDIIHFIKTHPVFYGVLTKGAVKELQKILPESCSIRTLNTVGDEYIVALTSR